MHGTQVNPHLPSRMEPELRVLAVDLLLCIILTPPNVALCASIRRTCTALDKFKYRQQIIRRDKWQNRSKHNCISSCGYTNRMHARPRELLTSPVAGSI